MKILSGLKSVVRMKKSNAWAFAAITLAPLITGSVYIWTTDTCITNACKKERSEELAKLIENEWENISEVILKKQIISEITREELQKIIDRDFSEKRKSLDDNFYGSFYKRSEKCRLYVYQERQNECYSEMHANHDARTKSITDKKSDLEFKLNELIDLSDKIEKSFKIMVAPKSEEDLNKLISINENFNRQFLEIIDDISKVDKSFENEIQKSRADLASVEAQFSRKVEKLKNLIKGTD
jgi:hypothetical protein